MRAEFCLDVRSDHLEWSADMHLLYGYADEPARPSMDLLTSHKHPADLPRMNQLIRRAITHQEPYVYRHRIITTDDRVRTIAVSATPSVVERGRSRVISGVTIDLTDATQGRSFEDDPDADVLLRKIANLEKALESRDVIGQAKGVLMQAYRIPATQAFELLTLASQRRNRKLAEIADEVARTGVLRAENG